MYDKSDVFNIRNSDYELTEMDERIYNETGFVLHQVDSHLVVYKPRFGSSYNVINIYIPRSGEIYAGVWSFGGPEGDDKEFEEEPVPDNLVDLMKLKYKEMLEGYWSSN